jgi:hypothetical protein
MPSQSGSAEFEAYQLRASIPNPTTLTVPQGIVGRGPRTKAKQTGFFLSATINNYFSNKDF